MARQGTSKQAEGSRRQQGQLKSEQTPSQLSPQAQLVAKTPSQSRLNKLSPHAQLTAQKPPSQLLLAKLSTRAQLTGQTSAHASFVRRRRSSVKPRREHSRRHNVVHSLTRERFEELKRAFAYFDRSNNGVISVNDMGRIMEFLGQEATREELEEMMREADTDGNGNIELDEFVAFMEQKLSQLGERNRLLVAFREYDLDGDGVITSEELKLTMEKFGDYFTEQEIDNVIGKIDLNGDKVIDYREFVKMMSTEMKEPLRNDSDSN